MGISTAQGKQTEHGMLKVSGNSLALPGLRESLSLYIYCKSDITITVISSLPSHPLPAFCEPNSKDNSSFITHSLPFPCYSLGWCLESELA